MSVSRSSIINQVQIKNGTSYTTYSIAPTFLVDSSTTYTLSAPTLTADSVIATQAYVNTYGGKINVIQAEGTPLTITNKTVNITAADLGLSAAMKFLGTTTTAISDGSTTNPITIEEESVTATSGNVVLYNNKEFVWSNSAWEELGDESSHALKTITITGTGALSGGGSLESNRTITHNEILGTAQSAGLYKIAFDKYGHATSVTAAVKTDIPNYSTWDSKVSDVQVNGTSVVSSNIANILTESAYNASTNKLATMADIPTGETDLNINDESTTATEAQFICITVGNSTDGYTRYKLDTATTAEVEALF